MPKSQTSLLFLFKSQSQEQHQHINTDILTPMFALFKINTNSKLNDSVNQSMKHFLLHASSLQPEKFLHQRTPMCWTRGKFSARMRHSFCCHLKTHKNVKSHLPLQAWSWKSASGSPRWQCWKEEYAGAGGRGSRAGRGISPGTPFPGAVIPIL